MSVGGSHDRGVLDKALSGERISDDDATTLLREPRPRRGRPGGGRAPQPQGRSATGSRSSSTETSTTRTSATRTATSAPSTAVRATRARATCSRSRSSSRRSRRRSPRRHRAPDAGRPSPRSRGRLLQEDLFRSIKARYPIHLHALSPPEVQHIARRSKLTIPRHSPACVTRASTRSPAAAPRSSSTACAT